MEKALSLQNQLRNYSALAGVVLTATSAQSQIIYTDIDDVVLYSETEDLLQHYLDVDNDGTAEFRFQMSKNGTAGFYYYLYQWLREEIDFGDALDWAQRTSSWVVVDLLAYGEEFGPPHTNPTTYFSSSAFFKVAFFDGSKNLISHYGDWSGVTNGYAGFRWKWHVNDPWLYGWVRLDVNPDGLSYDKAKIVIKDYAYNATPNATLFAGEGGAFAPCDPYEDNDKFSEAALISSNETIQAAINPSGDKDFFSFAVGGAAPHLRIILSDLPKNYDIVLYNEQKEKLAKAKNLKKVNDTIIYNNAAVGLYYLKVIQKDSLFSEDCYSLIVERSDTPFKLLPLDDINADIQVFPNPASHKIQISSDIFSASEALISVYDLAGKLLMSLSHQANDEGESVTIDISLLPPGAYLLQINSDNRIAVNRFIVSRQ